MHKGIVMEVTNKHLVVLRPDGRFDRVSRRNRTCQIGEEIQYARAGINWRSPSVAGRSALAAAVVFSLVVFASFNGKLGSPEVVAYITMDINPSVEMGIDVQENVLELRGLNDDGNILIEQLDYKGKNLEQVTERLLDNAERGALAKGEGEIVISSTVIQLDSKVNDESIAEKMKQQVTKHIETTHPQQVKQYQVAAFAAPAEVREAAGQNGVSTGKYSVYLNAKNSGSDVTLDEIKKESVLQISKSKPEVAQSIQNKVPSKADLKKLVQEEKSGELDKKLSESKNAGKNGKDTNDNKKNQNSANTGSKTSSTGNASTSKNDPKKSGTSNGKNNNSRDDEDDKSSGSTKNRNGKDDDKKDDKKDSGKPSSGSAKPGTTGSQTGGAKPGTPGSGTSRDKDDGKNRNDDDDKNDRGKDDPKRVEETKRAEEQRKKQEEERKKQEEQRKKQEAERKKAEEQKKKQESDGKKQEADGKRQEADGKKQESDNKKQEDAGKKPGGSDKKQEEAKKSNDSDGRS
ncbi:anti-sigma factor domain-containing protein [Paenibacillus filicis]|uniref:Anti-sigma factor domain-containing protein n=1 Tax=Paenibacillus filicis TaxID=669464 RepID=A0ABU9DQ19_9BACL